jgi:dethiobiotin synthetase
MNSVREVELTMRRYEQNGIELKGAIFNGIEKRSSAKYGYGAYSYYNYEYSRTAFDLELSAPKSHAHVYHWPQVQRETL